MPKKNPLRAHLSPAMAARRTYAGAAISRSGTPAARMIRILIADDHTVMRQGLSVSLSREPDMAIVGEAADGLTAVNKTRSLRPEVVLMDYGMPQMSGIEATRQIHLEMPQVRVIGLSAFEQGESAEEFLEAGAVSCLSRNSTFEELIAAIRGSAGISKIPSG